MSDDSSKKTSQDRSRINMSEDYEVRYWRETSGISRERPGEIVKKVGHSLQAIERELGSGPAHSAG